MTMTWQDVNRLLDKHWTIQTVVIVSKRCLVPAIYSSPGTRLVLDWGRNLPKLIRGLAVDELGIRGTLSFGGQDIFCDIPWAAVVSIIEPDKDGKRVTVHTPPPGRLVLPAFPNPFRAKRPELTLLQGGKSKGRIKGRLTSIRSRKLGPNGKGAA